MNACVVCGTRVKDEDLVGVVCSVCRKAGHEALTLDGVG